MIRIRKVTANILHYGGLHIVGDCLENLDSLSQIVQHDMINSSITLDDLKTCHLVLDFIGEGQCDKSIRNLVIYLRSIPVKSLHVLFGADVDTSSLDYPAIAITDTLVNNFEWFTKLNLHPLEWETDCDFLCLMRRPSISRARFGSSLLRLVQNIRLSFGTLAQVEGEVADYQSLFESHKLPLLIDGPVYNANDHNVDSLLLRKCAVNIIVETSSQSDVPSWRSILVSEKTFKAFGMLQFPIWWAVPGVVNCVRRMGFDLFDDIIDHSYDQITDEDRRMAKVLEQVKKLESLEPAKLRKQYQSRLLSNYNLLMDKIAQNEKYRFDNMLKQFNLTQ